MEEVLSQETGTNTITNTITNTDTITHTITITIFIDLKMYATKIYPSAPFEPITKIEEELEKKRVKQLPYFF